MISMGLGEVAKLVNGELHGKDCRFAAVSTDSRHIQPGELFVALRGPKFDGHDFLAVARDRGACGALVNQLAKVNLPLIRVNDTRLALGQLGAAWRGRFNGPVIAVTGSNGKTTVKEMLSSILRCRGQVLATQGNLNNDIGMPLTLLRLQEEDAYAVIEMGANHAGEIAYLSKLARPNVALINNAGPAHLEGFGDLDGVARAKGEIFQGLGPNGVAVINYDDAYVDYWSSLVQDQRIIGFSLEREAEVRGRILGNDYKTFKLQALGQEIEISLPLFGIHNIRNGLAAAAASLAVGATLEEICTGLQRVSAVTGRLQWLSGRGGATVVNDAYNANPASLAAALATVGGDSKAKWLVLGDMAELGVGAEALHEQAGHQVRAAGFKRLYGLGDQSRLAVSAFGSGGQHFTTAEELIRILGEAVDTANDKPVILVKGSRSMRMERIVQSLCATQHAPEERGARLSC